MKIAVVGTGAIGLEAPYIETLCAVQRRRQARFAQG
jgi:hypothetical protein